MAFATRIAAAATGGHRTSREVAWGIADLELRQADAARLLSLARGDGIIADRTESVRDASFGENRCRILCGNGLQFLSAFRNLGFDALRAAGGPNASASLRHCARNLPDDSKMLHIANQDADLCGSCEPGWGVHGANSEIGVRWR